MADILGVLCLWELKVEFRGLVWMVLYILEVAAFTEEILFIGLKYGCPVEDVITGLSIQCHGWRSVYCNPTRQAFLGIAPTTLSQTLVQVLLSEDSPAYAHGKIGLGLKPFAHTICICDICQVHLELCGVSVVWWYNLRFSDEDVSHNYEKEVMEFGALSPMFTILATLALLNLFCFLGVVKEAIMGEGMTKVYETMPLQILLCGVLILINLPLYQALYLRKDKGKMPSSTTFKSMAFSVFACICDASLLLSWVPAVCASYLFCHPCRIRFMLGWSD
ncbi:PREDICTED: cellulose synthase [Prunus dulcis]|uniref:PREDICTED: cellulose synthase n=1 Tax=Prunus dulcis TaxID=3755 RepID=A0A5E4ELX4_PRUDU|nr:PREDICTED: cellulose synthase [Prunus dulcis]